MSDPIVTPATASTRNLKLAFLDKLNKPLQVKELTAVPTEVEDCDIYVMPATLADKFMPLHHGRVTRFVAFYGASTVPTFRGWEVYKKGNDYVVLTRILSNP